jgi:hypothetical protein
MTHTDRFSGANHRGYPEIVHTSFGSRSGGVLSALTTDPVLREALSRQGYQFSESVSDGDHISGATAHGFGNGITQSGRNRT